MVFASRIAGTICHENISVYIAERMDSWHMALLAVIVILFSIVSISFPGPSRAIAKLTEHVTQRGALSHKLACYCPDFEKLSSS